MRKERPEVDWPALLRTALTSPGHASDTYCRFYRYSMSNQMLLMLQGVFEPVATYRRWQDLGRQVQKGAKARSIIRPVTCKRDEPTPTDPEHKATWTRFVLVPCLFPVSDTEGEGLPPYESPLWDAATAIVGLGVDTETFHVPDGNVQGYSHGHTVAVSPVARYPMKTLVHELAHVTLGHTGGDAEDEHRGVQEAQAEATAYIVMTEAAESGAWDPDASRSYIQTWMSGGELTEKHIRRIFTAADGILKAGQLEP